MFNKLVVSRVLAVCLLGGSAVLGASSAAALNQAQEWQFKVFLDEREIGFHEFTVTREADATRVAIDARFDVKILFFNAYRYRHQNAELWNDDCLVSVEAATNDNGRRSTVAGGLEGGAFVVQTADEKTSLQSCPMSFAYWNPALLESDQLLNPQTGEMLPLEVIPRGEDSVRYQDRELAALRYDLQVDGQTISLWYGADDYRWLALETPVRGGRTLRYQPVRLPLAQSETQSGGQLGAR